MKIITFLMSVALVATGSIPQVYAGQLSAEQIKIGERVDVATKEAIEKAQASLSSAAVKSDSCIAVLPFYGDENDIIRDRMKNAVTACGKTCVEDKDSVILQAILKEIAWDERKQDVLDPATAAKFGRLKGAQYLLYGGMISRNVTSRYALVELEFHLTEIATKKHVWGGTFESRVYGSTPDPQGLVEIPLGIRNAMRGKLRDALAASLKKSEKLPNVKKVVCLPISADEDGYASGLVRDVLASSPTLTPVNLDVSTRAEARFALREYPDKGDAILYGALRDIKASLKSIHSDQSRTYTARIELQLWIEKGTTREILWSDTLFESEDFEFDVKHGVWDKLCAFWPALVTSPWLIVVVPLGILLALIVLIIIVKNATRVR